MAWRSTQVKKGTFSMTHSNSKIDSVASSEQNIFFGSTGQPSRGTSSQYFALNNYKKFAAL